MAQTRNTTQSRIDRAMRAYGRALAVADPIRLQFWDSRGLTMPQLRLMYLLLLQDCRPVGELAEQMNVRPATVTGLTDRLVRQGLIERQADPEDRRVVRVALTPEGRRVVGEIETASRAYLQAIFDRLGTDVVDSLVELFEQFSDAAEAVQREGEPPK
jgi:DNA-binding MarR family transcriptional regulator